MLFPRSEVTPSQANVGEICHPELVDTRQPHAIC
jgi:hypothetical protein